MFDIEFYLYITAKYFFFQSFFNLEYLSWIKYFDVNSKYFRVEKKLPRENFKNIVNLAVIG